MHTHSATLTFQIPHASSLKDKRQARHSIVEKTRKRFNVAIAEVDTQDIHQTLTLGIAVVSGEFSHGQKYLEDVIRFMELNQHAELVDILYGDN